MTPYPDDPPTIRESTIASTGRDGAEPPSISEFIEPTLTGQSFHEFHLVRQFPAAGGEADIWLVSRDRRYYILKLYRLGIDPKLEVLEKVSTISNKNPKHLIRIFRYGFDDETKRWYEIQEYARNGSLKDLIREHQISMVQFRTIIGEITHSLHALHQNNILHLDLKPSNILVRSISPLNLILTDFGISTLLDTELSRQITSTKGTPMYWAPEQLGNVVGKEADYWALGVIGLEIIQNRHPFEGMNHNIILSTLSTRGIAVPADIQPKTATLLKGLLTRNPRKRWGKKEITEWLAGRQNIPVFYEGDQGTGPEIRKPYEFRGEQLRNLTELSYAFVSDPSSWEDAKRHIGRGYLTRWLEKTEQYGPAVEIEKCTELYPREDERLLYIIARFNPDIPFTLFGKPLDISSISLYLARYLNRENDEPEKRIISMIFSGELQRIFQVFTEITSHKDEVSLLSQMFSWLSANTRGIDEKKRLYEYIRILKEREEIGPPQEWDATAVLRLAEIRDLFLRQGCDRDATKCEEDLEIATRQALSSETAEPDLLVALASVSEEFGHIQSVPLCLKKASGYDIRVVSLLFNRKKGIPRFRLYKKLRLEYEKNLYSLSSEPWKERFSFWKDLFFILLSDGNYPCALSVSERIIEMDYQNGEGWAMRGVCLSRMGRVKEADYLLSGKIVQESKSPLVWQIIGEYYAGLNRYDEAEKNYKRGLESEKTHAGSLFGLINLYSSQKRYHEIIPLCDAALAHDPDNQGLLLQKGDAEFALGQIPEAMLTYERYMNVAPANIGVLKCLARCQIKLKKNADAERSLDILLKQEERDPLVFRLKAYLLLVSGKIEEALSYLDMALGIEPEDIWTLRVKADAHISLKEFSPALRCIDRILAIEPDNCLYLEKKGKILLSLGFFSDAVVPLRQAIDLGRISADLYVQYGDALRGQLFARYGSVAGQNLQNAGSLHWRVSSLYLDIWQPPLPTPEGILVLGEVMDWYDRSAARTPDQASLWNRKGIVASMLHDFEGAEMFFGQAIREIKQQPAYLSNLAVMHHLKGDSDRAYDLFLQGMKRFSNNPYFLDQYAGLFSVGRRDQAAALDLIGQAVTANTARDPGILYHKYLLLKNTGREEESREVSREILSIDPWFILSDR
jgi:tetratricopeptide (TPR) repeat protein/serine/threonine protein kinase